MTSIFEMKGARRAAALMVALGPELAADIMKHLDGESIDTITAEIAHIGNLSKYDREDLIGEFLIDLKKESRKIGAGKSKAGELLEKAFGREKADEVMKKIATVDVGREFEFLNEVDSDVLFGFLKDEQPQTIAVAMSYLQPAKSAAVLKMLTPEQKKSVAIRIARLGAVAPEAVLEIVKVLKAKYREYLKGAAGSAPAGGVDTLISILGHMSGEEEKNLMRQFDSSLPDIARGIREKLFTFDAIVNLTNNDMRILIDEINNDNTIAIALKGAGDQIRFKFLRNMSQNRATDIIEEMKNLGAVRLSEIEESRMVIVNIVRTLHDNGVIILRRDGEILVE